MSPKVDGAVVGGAVVVEGCVIVGGVVVEGVVCGGVVTAGVPFGGRGGVDGVSFSLMHAIASIIKTINRANFFMLLLL